MLSAAAFPSFRVNRSGHHIPRRKLHFFWVVALHESFAILVPQHTPFTSNSFGYQNALHARWPDHSCRMKLYELHVHQLSPCCVREGHSVARVFPGVRRNAPGLPDPASRNNNRFCFENGEPSRLPPISQGAADAFSILEQPRDSAFHVNINSQMNAAILQGANHLESGTIAYVAETLERVSAERSLQNVSLAGAIKQRAPLLQLSNAFGRLQRVNLCHAPVVQKFAAAHGVAKVGAPIVCLIDIRHRGRDSTLGHHCVRFAQQRLANNSNPGALAQRRNRRAQSGATGADD